MVIVWVYLFISIVIVFFEFFFLIFKFSITVFHLCHFGIMFCRIAFDVILFILIRAISITCMHIKLPVEFGLPSSMYIELWSLCLPVLLHVSFELCCLYWIIDTMFFPRYMRICYHYLCHGFLCAINIVLGSLQYCAMGLGLVGVDFRGLLPPLFEEYLSTLH